MSDNAKTSVLSVGRRETSRRTLEREGVDVLVIGGGVVGAGAALDATTRGLSVAVLEARDWASGTSSRSSKLVHGGIRYLEQLDFKLVREALRERGRLLTTVAPHLVTPVPFLYPLKTRVIERAYVGAGMTLYDMLSGTKSGVARHRHLSAAGLRREMPGLIDGGFVGGLCYFDAQVDDARLVVTLVRTAAENGALAMNHASVVDVDTVPSGDKGYRVTIRDHETNDEFTTFARHIVNATGVWTEESQALIDADPGFTVTMSKGIHLVVARDRIPLDLGLLLRTERSVLFVIPWGGFWLVGTTDTPWTFDKANPAATSTDIDYLLEHVNTVLETPLTYDDILGVWSGLRPLVAGTASSTTTLSREHVVGTPRPGVAFIGGGKLTTYRVMADDVVTAALSSAGTKAARSATANLPLLGAVGFENAADATRESLRSRGLPTDLADRLVNRYGSMAPDVVALVDGNPQWKELLPGSTNVHGFEIAYAVLAEDARHLDDVVVRRTRMAMEQFDSGRAALDTIADIMANLLGWKGEQRSAEIERYLTHLQLEEDALSFATDREADAVLRTAPSVEVTPKRKRRRDENSRA